MPSDRWLDAVADAARGAPLARLLPGGPGGWVDLRLAFAALGAGRLRDATELRLEEVLKKGSYALPIRQGLQTVGGGRRRPPRKAARRGRGATRRTPGGARSRAR